MTRPIVLVTDFGTLDPYVGQLKAVIAAIAPSAPVVDLTHEIEPFAIDEAAWCIETALNVIPANAVVCAVVDPGVGTDRRGIVARAGDRYFVGPDNGILSCAFTASCRDTAGTGPKVTLGEDSGCAVYELRSPQFRLPKTSATFHGRDIFAPAAAHLANGVDHRLFGPPVAEATLLPPFCGRPAAMGELEGYIVRVDRFGNLLTTIRAAELFPSFEICVGGVCIDRHVRTFANVSPGQLLCHADSSGFVAIAVNHGSAAVATGARRGDPVTVRAT
jgi:S-adenosylmethionine hydrolase